MINAIMVFFGFIDIRCAVGRCKNLWVGLTSTQRFPTGALSMLREQVRAKFLICLCETEETNERGVVSCSCCWIPFHYGFSPKPYDGGHGL